MLSGGCGGGSGNASILATGTVPSLTWWHQGRLPGGEEDWSMLLYALALLCFQFIISPTSWASARRWRWLSSRSSRLMFPLHQQNIWESKHKAGEAEWESQPEPKWRGGDVQSMEPCPLHAPWVLGARESCAGCWGSICAGWSPPKPQHRDERQGNLLSTETALQWKQGWEQKYMQWRKNLVTPGAQQAHTVHPKVKGGSFCHAWGSGDRKSVV